MRKITMFALALAMLILAACSDRETPGGAAPEPPANQTSVSSSEAESDAESTEPESTPAASAESAESSPRETIPPDAAEPPDNTLPVDISLPVICKTDESIDETISFSIYLPADWTLSDTGTTIEFFDENENLVAEAVGRNLTLEDTDPMYSGAVSIRDFVVGEYKGKYYHMQSEVVDSGLSVLQNGLIYCLSTGEGMIVFTFYPYFGAGIGTQNERFASYIDTIVLAE